MSMQRKAYHRIRLSDGSVVDGPVVVVTSDDGSASWYKLETEEAATVWCGGEIQI